MKRGELLKKAANGGGVKLSEKSGIQITVILEGPTGITVQAKGLLDTGASQSCIGDGLVNLLRLNRVGTGKQLTTAGIVDTGVYTVNVSFPELPVRKRTGLRCMGVYTPSGQEKQNLNLEYGFLIGLDLMKDWRITIDGPSGSVRITGS